jgi:uncharacterized membrane protein
MSDTPLRSDIRAIALIAYGLFLLALVNGITAIAGVILLYVRRDEARGTPWEGHFRNLIQVFWICTVVFAVAISALSSGLIYALVTTNGHPPDAMIGGLFVAVPLLWLGGVAFLIWYLFRVVGGFVRALDGVPY